MTATQPIGTRTAPDRLAVDWTRCDGHGLCHVLAPDLIKRDEWGFPELAKGVTASRRRLRGVVAACPAMALRLETR